MITTTKTYNNEYTVWEINGHASTDVCNGYSALLYTFCEELRSQTEELEYEIERSNVVIIGDNVGEEFFDGRDGKDSTHIRYRGKPISEHFFETGISLLADRFPEEVQPLQIIEA